jgi:uncharacterized protein (TIGR03435 family)
MTACVHLPKNLCASPVKILLFAPLLLAVAQPMYGQAAPFAAPEFEVATVKPVANPDPNRTYDRTEGRRFVAHHVTLRELIMMAYQLDAREIAGAPAWVASDEYDIEALAADENQLHEQREAMLQHLLADRFQLTFHRERRMLPVYVLTVARGGSKLKAAETSNGRGATCQHFGDCTFRSEPLAHFVRWLAFAILDRPVVDKTDLAGTFDFDLKWTPDESQFSTSGLRAPAAGDNPVAPPLFEAIQEQLGLKLEPEKMAAEVLVVDRVGPPTEN